ncbi:TPA: fimbrial protein [Providencia alcalifaciens]
MNQFAIYIGMLLFSSIAFADYRAEFSTYTVPITETLYVPKSAPINTHIATIELGTYTPWVWWNETGTTRVGINLPGIFDGHYQIAGVGAVKEIGLSGIGFALHGSVNSPCSARGYVNGKNSRDGNPANRFLCPSSASQGNYNVTLKAEFYKIRPRVNTQLLQSTSAAMFIVFNNRFITQDIVGNFEPKIWLSPIPVVANGCEVKNTIVNVAFGQVDKSEARGVGSTLMNSRKRFKIELDCDETSPIKIHFMGMVDSSGLPGTIALNNAEHRETAQGFGIQIKYKGRPIKLNQTLQVSRLNSAQHYVIPLEAVYIQTEEKTRGGKANGTLQFNLQYH